MLFSSFFSFSCIDFFLVPLVISAVLFPICVNMLFAVMPVIFGTLFFNLRIRAVCLLFCLFFNLVFLIPCPVIGTDSVFVLLPVLLEIFRVFLTKTEELCPLHPVFRENAVAVRARRAVQSAFRHILFGNTSPRSRVLFIIFSSHLTGAFWICPISHSLPCVSLLPEISKKTVVIIV